MRRKNRLAAILAWVTAVAAAIALVAFLGLAATRGERQVAAAPSTTAAPRSPFGEPAIEDRDGLSEACAAALEPVQERIDADPAGGTSLDAEHAREFRAEVDATYLSCAGHEIQFIERNVVAPWLNGR